MAYDDQDYAPLPPYDDPWSHIQDSRRSLTYADPWGRLPQRDRGVEEQPPSSYLPSRPYEPDYEDFGGLPGQRPQRKAQIDAARREKRPAWLDRLGAIGDMIADAMSAMSGQKPYFMKSDPGDVPRLSGGGGGGMSGSGFDPDRPGHLEMLGHLYLKQLAQQIAGEAMRKGEPMRSYYRPSGGEQSRGRS